MEVLNGPDVRSLGARLVDDCSSSELLAVVAARLESVGQEFCVRVYVSDAEGFTTTMRGSDAEAVGAFARARWPRAERVVVERRGD